jgi:hypothetical protein
VQELLKEAAVGRERRAAKDAEQLGEAGVGAKWIRDFYNRVRNDLTAAWRVSCDPRVVSYLAITTTTRQGGQRHGRAA